MLLRTILEKIVEFVNKLQFDYSLYPSMATNLHYYRQLLHFCQKMTDIMEKIGILGTFKCL